jgi:hypothetical protein
MNTNKILFFLNSFVCIRVHSCPFVSIRVHSCPFVDKILSYLAKRIAKPTIDHHALVDLRSFHRIALRSMLPGFSRKTIEGVG